MSSNSLAEEITPKIFKFSFKDFQEKYNKPYLIYDHIILTAPDLLKPPCWRQLIILSSVSFYFLSKNDHINIGQYGVLMTQVFFTLQLMGLGGSWIFNSGNSKSGFVCLSFRHVQTTWQQKSLQSFSYFSFKDFKKVRNFSFMK